MQLELPLSALLQLHLHSQLNTWLQWIGQRQQQDETRNIDVLGLGAPYIKELTLHNASCNPPIVMPIIHSHIHGQSCKKNYICKYTFIISGFLYFAYKYYLLNKHFVTKISFDHTYCHSYVNTSKKQFLYATVHWSLSFIHSPYKASTNW